MSIWDDASQIESVVWQMRLADSRRGTDRDILNKLYNGEPPFSESEAEENNIEINRNDLEGPNMLSQARRQWYQGFLPAGNFCNIALDSGPSHKRKEWSHSITRNYNRVLKRSRAYIEHVRATGANAMLHGIAPTIWNTKQSVTPVPMAVSSVLVPSETGLEFDNLPYVAIFREWTAAQLYRLTHGPKVDPGWNMDLVDSQLQYIGEQTQKQPNMGTFQWMPERITELIKQDSCFWSSDAVPTIDAWDFFYRDEEDAKGWKRKIVLDWGDVAVGTGHAAVMPDNRSGGKFLYNSGNRKYAADLSQILHCQFGDCSAVAPFKYHSVRSLGWMLWGVCDLQNRLHCKFNEAVFENLMWFFRCASNADLVRLKKAEFYHYGVIPQGIANVPANERYKPDPALMEMAFGRNRQLMQENAASFTQDFSRADSGREMTATEIMARVNSVNALVSGMMSLAYTYEEFKDREIARRVCIKHNPDPLAQKFRLGCLHDGVPEEMLDAERWDITRERALGGGNKTLEMAQVQFLQGIRKNLNPDAQRRVDHISVEATTDDAALAEDLAPLQGQMQISNSMDSAQKVTDRLMRGLPFIPPPDTIPEDYVKVWLADMAVMIRKANENGGMASGEQIAGFANIAEEIGKMLNVMSSNPDDMPRVRAYGEALKNLMNQVRAFAQRLKAAMAKQQQNGEGNGTAGIDAETAAKLKGKLIIDQAKAQNLRESHAIKTAQKQAQFELEQQRKDRETAAELRRENMRTGQELVHNRLKAFQE